MLAISSTFIITKNIAIVEVDGNSMAPTYKDGDVAIMKKSKEIKRDSVVIFNSPKSWNLNEKMFIKRIIGVEGDKIEVKNDFLYRNDVKIANIEARACTPEKATIIVSRGNIFVAGDNHGASNDSLTKLCMDSSDYLIDTDKIVVIGKPFVLN